MGNSSSVVNSSSRELNWRRRLWYEIYREPFPLYIYNMFNRTWYRWIDLHPGDKFLTITKVSINKYGVGHSTVIQHNQQPWIPNDDNLADCIYKLHIMIDGVEKYVPLPVLNQGLINRGFPSGVFVPPQHNEFFITEDPFAINQTDKDGHPKPDEDDFLHVISNYEGLPVATPEEIKSRITPSANNNDLVWNFLKTKHKIRF